jgi:hypothetical protein
MCLDRLQQAASDTSPAVVGMNVKHVDVTVGFEIGETCDFTIYLGNPCWILRTPTFPYAPVHPRPRLHLGSGIMA